MRYLIPFHFSCRYADDPWRLYDEIAAACPQTVRVGWDHGRVPPNGFRIPNGGSPAVLISTEDWEAIQETLFLLAVPGMRESIKEGMAEPIDSCAKELDW